MSQFEPTDEILKVVRGIQIINVTPHPITFGFEGEDETVVVEPSGFLINARSVEEVVKEDFRGESKVTFVRTSFVPDEDSEHLLQMLEEKFPEAVIIGSIIAAQAFPGRVVAMIPVKGYERVPTLEKRVKHDRFTVF